MNKKIIGIILIVLALGVVGYWATNGGGLLQTDKVAVVVKDELFGTESTEWHDEFHPGLLPYLGPTALALLIAGGWLVVSAARDSRRARVA